MKTYFASIPFPFKHISINVVDRVSDSSCLECKTEKKHIKKKNERGKQQHHQQ